MITKAPFRLVAQQPCSNPGTVPEVLTVYLRCRSAVAADFTVGILKAILPACVEVIYRNALFQLFASRTTVTRD